MEWLIQILFEVFLVDVFSPWKMWKTGDAGQENGFLLFVAGMSLLVKWYDLRKSKS